VAPNLLRLTTRYYQQSGAYFYRVSFDADPSGTENPTGRDETGPISWESVGAGF